MPTSEALSTESKPLSPKKARFVAEYLIDHNGQQAAIRAGYSPRGATTQAVRLLANASVSLAVQAQTAALLAARTATAAQVLETVTSWVLADPRHYVRPDGSLKALNELTPQESAALQSFDIVSGNVDSGDGGRDRIARYKLVDKVRAADILAKYHGLAQPKEVRVGLTDDLMTLLSAARKRLAAQPALEAELLTEEDRHRLRDNPGAVQVQQGLDPGPGDRDPSRE